MTDTSIVRNFHQKWFKNIDLANLFVAGFVGLVVFVVYLRTMAPTMTFWDCGEFIACCFGLDIPHPPGNPLYIQFGRLFALLPIFNDPGARTNFLSVVCATATAVFGYLSGVRILRPWLDSKETLYNRMLLYGGPASGAFFLAFGKTQWGNSIETEVYGMAILFSFIILWLSLIYWEKSGTTSAEPFLLTAIYLAFLSVGVHLTAFLMFPACTLLFILKKDIPTRYWYLIGVTVVFELFLIFVLSSKPGEIPYYIPVLVVFIVFLLYMFSLDRAPKTVLVYAIGFLVSIAPLYEKIIELISNPSQKATQTSSSISLVTVIGLIGLGSLFIYGLVTVFKIRSKQHKKTEDDETILISSLFAIASAVMAVIPLLKIRGYELFLVVGGLSFLVLCIAIARYIRWPILIAISGVSLIMIGIYPFLIGLGIVAVVSLVLMFGKNRQEWRIAFLITVVAILGMSIHVFLPIRSAQKPRIDNSSVSRGFKSVVDFIERKQYGSESMTHRMFKRRGEWENQFGNYQRMGFWNFFQQQFGLTGPRFLVLFVLGMLGLMEIVRRGPPGGTTFALLIILTSVGLVLYMNFADGTRINPVTGGDYLEVRDRDYFFTQAFMLFGLAIGLGIAGLLKYLQGITINMNSGIRKIILSSSLVLFLLPVYAVSGNYWEIDRSRNYIAYDYGSNLLNSADPNAILFTFADNDTFTLWSMQEGYGVRRDVSVVCLTLANLDWYVKHIQDVLKVDLGWSSDQIDKLRAYRNSNGKPIDISDQVIDAVVKNNFGKRPINFSVTVPPSMRQYQGSPVDKRLTLTGLVWRFTDRTDGPKPSVDEILNYFYDTNRFKFRGLLDPSVYQDENMKRLVTIYPNSIFMACDSLYGARRYTEAEKLLRFAFDNLPYEETIVSALGKIYADQGRVEELNTMIGKSTGESKQWLTIQMAHYLIKSGDKSQGEAILNQILLMTPNYRPAFEELATYYNGSGQYNKLKTLFQMWVKANPSDSKVKELLQELERIGEQRNIQDTVKK